MHREEIIEALKSAISLVLGSASWIMQEAYPFLSFVAVLCGAILGLHGVYVLITKRKNTHYKD